MGKRWRGATARPGLRRQAWRDAKVQLGIVKLAGRISRDTCRVETEVGDAEPIITPAPC